MDRMNKIEFEMLLQHAPETELQNVASIMEELLFVPINKDQNRIEMIDTLAAIYYKDKTKIHKNSFGTTNHLTLFDYSIHYSCPINEANTLRLPYFILVDKFGFNTKFSRVDARIAIKTAYDTLNIFVDENHIVYRMFQTLSRNFNNLGIFTLSFKDRKHVMIYEVLDWNPSQPIINNMHS